MTDEQLIPPPPPPTFNEPMHPGSWPPGPPSPPPVHPALDPPRARRGFRPALIAALMIVSAAGGAGAASLAHARVAPGSSSTPGASLISPAQPSAGTGGSSSNGSSSTTSDTAAAIAAKVDPGVVDIVSTLAGGGQAAGTGMVITSGGEVLTNNHVIQGSTSVTVQVAGTGPTYQAKVVGDDPTADIALLQIQGASNLQTVSLGDSSSLTQGQNVVAIGNALGKGGTPVATEGQVTGLNQTITASDQSGANAETLTGLVQTSAFIQPGDSGGPLVDTSAHVIAMNTAAESSGQPGQNAGSSNAYAISINNAMTAVHQIEAGGAGNPNIQIGGGALLGVSISTQSTTATVLGVAAGSPAAGAGITAGSVITSLDGTAITTPSSLHTAMLHHRPGDSVRVSWTDASGTPHTAGVTLASGPPA